MILTRLDFQWWNQTSTVRRTARRYPSGQAGRLFVLVFFFFLCFFQGTAHCLILMDAFHLAGFGSTCYNFVLGRMGGAVGAQPRRFAFGVVMFQVPVEGDDEYFPVFIFTDEWGSSSPCIFAYIFQHSWVFLFLVFPFLFFFSTFFCRI